MRRHTGEHQAYPIRPEPLVSNNKRLSFLTDMLKLNYSITALCIGELNEQNKLANYLTNIQYGCGG